MKLKLNLIAMLAVIAAMASIQYGATIAKGLFNELGIPCVTMLRTTLAAVILTGVSRPWRGGPLPRRAFLPLIAYGLSIAGMNFAFYLSIERIPLGISVALQFLGPLGIALASSRRLTDVLWAALAVGGIMMLEPGADMTHSVALDHLGIFYALVAGACWALYIVSGRRAGLLIPAGRVSSLGLVIAALAVIPIGLLHRHENLLHAKLWIYAPVVAVFSCALPYSLEALAMTKLPAKVFGVLMSLEPVFATLLGHYILLEVLHPEQWCGIAAISVASVGSIVWTTDSGSVISGQEVADV